MRFAQACAFVLALQGGAVRADPIITDARFGEPTGRYDHGILGDKLEWGTLVLNLRDGNATSRVVIRLPDTRVFEDLHPRLVDVDGQGGPEVIVVETDLGLGARLSVYDANGLRDATPFIGRTHRWLAPIGAADLDGDGHVEIAYVEKPHLSRVLTIWRWSDQDRLEPVVTQAGFTNHQIGQNYISGGIRTCDGGPEMIVADGNWSRIMAVVLKDGQLNSRPLGPFKGRDSFTAALNCR